MYQSVNFSQFCDAFRKAERHENFSYEAKRHLFDYIESYEEDLGEQWELDIIALCCDYEEEELEHVLDNYNLETLEQLQDSTCVINFNEKSGKVLYQVF